VLLWAFETAVDCAWKSGKRLLSPPEQQHLRERERVGVGDRQERHRSTEGIEAAFRSVVKREPGRAAESNHFNVLPEHFGRMAGAERLHRRFLCGEPSRKMDRGFAAPRAVGNFAVGEYAAKEPVAVLADCRLDSRNVGRVNAEPDDGHLLMIMPVPHAAFEWRDTAWGPVLVCTPLEQIARHLFTTRPWSLGANRDGGSAEWGDVVAAFERPLEALVRSRQVHGNHTVMADDRVAISGLPVGDILVGRNAGRVLAVQAADCVPLLVADRATGAVAAAHAGWRGLVQRVPMITVSRIHEAFGSEPNDLVAAIGPSIGACCYEVGVEVRDKFATVFTDTEVQRWFSRTARHSPTNPPMPGVVINGRDAHWFFDGWQCTCDQLISAGVRPEQAYVATLCTASHPHVLCSYRRDGLLAGRIAGAIAPAPAAEIS